MEKKFHEIGKRLESLRILPTKKPRKWLANQLDMKPNRIWRLEKGEYPPNAEEILKYVKYFNVSEKWILSGTEGKESPKDKGILEDILERLNNIEAQIGFSNKIKKGGNPSVKSGQSRKKGNKSA